MMDTGRHGKASWGLRFAFAVLIVLAAGIALAVGAILQDERDNRSAEAEVESGGLLADLAGMARVYLWRTRAGRARCERFSGEVRSARRRACRAS